MANEGMGFGIVIVAHGGLAEQYLATLQHVIGPQPRTIAVAIEDKDDRNQKRIEISEIVDKVDVGSGVVIVTDMFGGTPSNLALRCLPNENYRILYGVNMPSLIKLARQRHKPIDQALEQAVKAGHRYLNYCSDQPTGNK